MKKVLLAFIGGIFLFLAVFGVLKVKQWLEIDACLDSGGSWNYEKNRCEYDDPSKTESHVKGVGH